MSLGLSSGGRLLVSAAACMVALSGCTTTMAGTAARDPGVQPGMVDPALLEFGNYPTRQRPALGAAGDAQRGALLDAQRLADYVTGPWEVDPTLVKPISFGYSPAALPFLLDGIGMVFSPNSETNAALARRGLIYGFAAGREVVDQRALTNAVLRFSDPAAAAAAAADLGHSNPHPADLPPMPALTPVTIAGHPDAVAASFTWEDHDKNLTWTSVNSYTPHGPYVLFQRAEVVGPVDIASGLISKALDLQGPAIDPFTPTDPAQFATLPKDPSGLLALALPVRDGASGAVNPITVGVRGLLHFEYNPIRSAKNLADAGVDAAVQGAGWVYRTRDAAAATQLAKTVADNTVADGEKVDSEVPNLPGSHCQTNADDKTVDCWGSAGRYYFDVFGHTRKDAQQQAAAQYLILVAS